MRHRTLLANLLFAVQNAIYAGIKRLKKERALQANILFAACILAIAGGLFGWRAWKNAQNAGTRLMAQLQYGDDNTVLDIPLDKDAVYDVDTGYYTVHLKVQNGCARFYNSPCPNHTCESHGWISEEGQTVSCLPAHAVLTIVPAD